MIEMKQDRQPAETSIAALGVREMLSMKTIGTVRAFDAIEYEWRQLLEQSHATMFQSFEWMRTWWKHFGEPNDNAQLHIVKIRYGKKLVALAPLFIERLKRAGVIQLRKLVFIGRETTDYLDFIIAKGFEKECIAQFASHIATHTGLYDVVHLVDMPERTGNHELLHNELLERGLVGERFVNEYCPRTTLATTWEKTLALLPSSKRSGLKRSQKKIESDFNVELHTTEDARALKTDFDEFVTLHQQRWNGSGQLGVFACQTTRAFHEEFATLAFERRWLFLAFLTLNGKRVAANYGFVHNNEFFYYLSGIQMQGELAKYSLGRILHMYSIAEAIRRGIGTYDFMRGTERYKYDFNSTDAQNWTILMYPHNGVASRLKFKGILLIDSLKRRAAKEKFLMQHAAKENGTNGSIAGLLAQRIRANLKDGLQKLKSPERSLSHRGEA
jgi:CelD/BcsL family acetyltransferase involved in cellulose biosynthesis